MTGLRGVLLCFMLGVSFCGGQAPTEERRTAPKVIRQTTAAYTPEAQKKQLAGTVVVSLTVDEHGKPHDLKVVKGLGSGLDEEALKAVPEWQFSAGTKNGEPVSSSMEVKVDFDLIMHPVLTQQVEPAYTKEARKRNISGDILLSLVVDADGTPKNIKVVSPLGLGLDEKAIEAVSKWRFKPGTKNGVPVPVMAQVEVSFRLCGENCGTLTQSERARVMFNLAILQLQGGPNQPDPHAAFQTMQKAVAMEYPPAETRLGLFHLQGIGTDKSATKAAEWFDKAAFHHDAEGEFQLGVLYFSGVGVARDRTMAFKLFRQAAEQDHRAAEYSLGIDYELGTGTEQSSAEAVKWYRKSAELGFAQAQAKLAKFHWLGVGCKQDQVAALEWAILAQRNGSETGAADVKSYESAMSPEQVAEAEKNADRFKVRTPKAKH